METAVNTDQKLAAIMFTDIISYTKMMSKNEKKTLSLLKEHNLLLFVIQLTVNLKNLHVNLIGYLIQYCTYRVQY